MSMPNDLTPEEHDEIMNEMQEYVCMYCGDTHAGYFGRLCNNRQGWVGDPVCPWCGGKTILQEVMNEFVEKFTDLIIKETGGIPPNAIREAFGFKPVDVTKEQKDGG